MNLWSDDNSSMMEANLCSVMEANLWSDDNSSMMEAFTASAELSGYHSWAAPSPGPPTPPAAVLSPAPASYFNQETLQQRLQTLIESAKKAWTYAIFWQSSVDVATGDSLLGWGDGYYKGGSEEDKRRGRSSASYAAEQEQRKRVLRVLNLLISGGPLPEEEEEEEVTDTEWFFLVSMTQSFVNGDGLPGQALFSGQPSFGIRRERARQGQQFGIQTIVCVPVGSGVLELGSTGLIFHRHVFSAAPEEAEEGSSPRASMLGNGTQGSSLLDNVRERFQEHVSQTKYIGAAELAATSPQGILRTPETVAKLQSVLVQYGQIPPLLQYFRRVTTGEKLNALETLQLSSLVLKKNKKHFLESWLADDKLECSEELGDLVKIIDNDLALTIYIKARVSPKVVAAFIETREFDKIHTYSKQVGYTPDYPFLLKMALESDPQVAVDFAMKMSELEGGCPIDYDAITGLFLQRNLIREATTFLLYVLKPNLPEHGSLQTKVLEINLFYFPRVADAILDKRMFSHYDRHQIGCLCENAGLFMRALQHYTELQDIKRVIVNTHAIDPQSLVEFFGTLSRESTLECMRGLLLERPRGYLQIVVQTANKYSGKFGVESCIELFEQFKSYEGLYFFLGPYMSSSQDPHIHSKYFEATVKTGRIKEVERVTRESNIYDAEKAKVSYSSPLNVYDRPVLCSDNEDSKQTRIGNCGTSSSVNKETEKIKTVISEKTDNKDNDNCGTTSLGMEKTRETSQDKYLEVIKVFSDLDIQTATDHFSETLKIGHGGYGSVYRCYLHNTEVAVKMLDANSDQGSDEFIQELAVLGRLRHPHLVNLIGACFKLRALVYEFLSNGSLEDMLNKNPRLLTWQIRTRIIYEIYLALNFLHSNKPQLLVHGDLKPHNILLDANFHIKLTDFGLCRFLPEGTTTVAFLQTKSIKGTEWYIDPDFLETGKLTPGCDVYSFGITILRILTGRKAARIDRKVERACGKKLLMEIVDCTAGEWPEDVAESLAHIGLDCCDRDKKSSQLMREISTKLDNILANI